LPTVARGRDKHQKAHPVTKAKPKNERKLPREGENLLDRMTGSYLRHTRNASGRRGSLNKVDRGKKRNPGKERTGKKKKNGPVLLLMSSSCRRHLGTRTQKNTTKEPHENLVGKKGKQHNPEKGGKIERREVQTQERGKKEPGKYDQRKR